MRVLICSGLSTAVLKSEGHVFAHRKMGKNGIVLEDHANVPFGRSMSLMRLSLKKKSPPSMVLKPAIMRRRVVLPPLGPRSVKNSPCRISGEVGYHHVVAIALDGILIVILTLIFLLLLQYMYWQESRGFLPVFATDCGLAIVLHENGLELLENLIPVRAQVFKIESTILISLTGVKNLLVVGRVMLAWRAVEDAHRAEPRRILRNR